MKPDGRFFLVFMMSLALIPGAYGIEFSGGTSISTCGMASSAEGCFESNNLEATAIMSSSGPVNFFDNHWVTDTTGKFASVGCNIVNGVISDYRYQLTPNKDHTTVPKTTSVSAKEWLTVSNADEIQATAGAQYGSLYTGGPAYVANVEVNVAKGSLSKYSNVATATANYAEASQSGQVHGIIRPDQSSQEGTGGEAYDANAKAWILHKRDSNGGAVDCALNTKSRSDTKGASVTGTSKFTVDALWGGRIQSAVDAAWDGDTINVAKGIYKENVAVDKSLTIAGAGAGKTIVDGDQKGSVFVIGMNNHNANVALSGMIIQGGTGTLTYNDYSFLAGGAFGILAP